METIDPNAHQKLIRDLSIALMYLTSWEEETITGESMRKAWRGYDFDVLDKLKDDDLISFSFKSKSLYLTNEGEEAARRVVERMIKSSGKATGY